MKKILFITIVVISFLIIHNLVLSIHTLWQKQTLIDQARKKLVQEKQENEKLKKQLSQAQSLQFIEQEARDKLMLLKPEEQRVVISKSLLETSRSAAPESSVSKPAWQEWIDLFFNEPTN